MKRIPNAITFVGMAAALLYAYASFICDMRLIIAGFAIAIFSDLIDGPLARKFGWVTELGRHIDPIRDRMILAAFLFQLYYWNYFEIPISSFFVALIITSESAIWAIRLFMERRYSIFVRTGFMGKLRQLAHVVLMSATIYTVSVDNTRDYHYITATVYLMAMSSLLACLWYLLEANALLATKRNLIL